VGVYFLKFIFTLLKTQIMKKYFTLKNLGWVFTVLTVLMLVMSSASKLGETEEMVNNFKFMNLSNYLFWVGLAEFAAIFLVVFDKTTIWGSLLVTCLMSGAVALHLSLMGGLGVLNPILLGLFAWTSHCLRKYY
jgi:hypothetical protein